MSLGKVAEGGLRLCGTPAPGRGEFAWRREALRDLERQGTDFAALVREQAASLPRGMGAGGKPWEWSAPRPPPSDARNAILLHGGGLCRGFPQTQSTSSCPRVLVSSCPRVHQRPRVLVSSCPRVCSRRYASRGQGAEEMLQDGVDERGVQHMLRQGFYAYTARRWLDALGIGPLSLTPDRVLVVTQEELAASPRALPGRTHAHARGRGGGGFAVSSAMPSTKAERPPRRRPSRTQNGLDSLFHPQS